MTRPFIAALLLILPGAALAQSTEECVRTYEAEKSRIEREMAATRPAQADRDAQQRWFKPYYEALEKAARTADACERRNRPGPSAAALSCMDRVRSDTDALQARYRGKTLSTAEQKTHREEEMKLHDRMMQCRTQQR